MDRIKLRRDLERDEARRNRMYKDSHGIETIGIGHNLRAKPISDRAVDVIFDDDVAEVEAALDDRMPWWRSLDDVRQRVLANMAFNLGVDGLLGFRNTLRAVHEGRYKDASELMSESLWARQVGDGPGGRFDRADRLERMMLTGKDA